MILEAIPEAPFPEPPEEWMQEIKVVYPASYYKSSSNSDWRGSTYTTSSSYSSSSRSSSYDNSNGNGRRFSKDEDDDEADDKPGSHKRLEGPKPGESKTSDEDKI
jgi:hypothetical protein